MWDEIVARDTPARAALATAMGSYWAAFARGDAMGEGWPSYSPATDVNAVFDVPHKPGATETGRRKKYCDFWEAQVSYFILEALSQNCALFPRRWSLAAADASSLTPALLPAPSRARALCCCISWERRRSPRQWRSRRCAVPSCRAAEPRCRVLWNRCLHSTTDIYSSKTKCHLAHSQGARSLSWPPVRNKATRV